MRMKMIQAARVVACCIRRVLDARLPVGAYGLRSR